MTMPIPYGVPVRFGGEYTYNENMPLYVQRFYADFKLRDGYLPTIQIKGSRFNLDTEYLKDSNGMRELTLTSVDFQIFKEHYEIIDIKYAGGYMFKSISGVFDGYINYWMKIKANNTGAIRELAKLMLNNLYGKFSKNPDITRKYPTLLDNKIRLVRYGKEYGETVYIPTGSFITANARSVTIRAAQRNYHRFIYSDTDSLHLVGWELPDGLRIHGSDLGAWDHEYNSIMSRFIRPKRYITTPISNAGETSCKIVCGGLPDNCKKQANWENFVKGTVYTGKLTPKQVDGGVYLEEGTFTMD